MAIDPKNLSGTARVTFAEEFNNLSLWTGASGRWATTFWYQDPKGNGGSLPNNGEQQWYINANYGPTAGIKPWAVNDGVLTITATPTPSWVKGHVNHYSYISGELNTHPSFSQTYGYFEMRAQLPKGQGFWPAFWLMPTNGAWPPELDVAEVLGQNPRGLVTTVHSNAGGRYVKNGTWTEVADTSAGFHTFGVNWQPDYITWYFDGQPVHKAATPADLNTPMYMIANLAVGGYWPGWADGHSSAQLKIDYIRAYTDAPSPAPQTPPPQSAPPQSGPPQSAPQPSPPSQGAPNGNGGRTYTSDNEGNRFNGTAHGDVFKLGRGGDVVTGGGGGDVFKFAETPWAGGHITDFGAADVLDLSAMFARYGYGGSNPVADGRIRFAADGSGGTNVWFVMDGLGKGHGTWLVTDLDKVAPSSVSIANGKITTDGSAGSGGGGPDGAPAGAIVLGDTQHWTGGRGADVVYLGRGGSVVAGGGGNDAFKFSDIPWKAAEITDFSRGDGLDLTEMFGKHDYYPRNPVADGRIKLISDGTGGTDIWFVADGLTDASGVWLLANVHQEPHNLSVGGGWITA